MIRYLYVNVKLAGARVAAARTDSPGAPGSASLGEHAREAVKRTNVAAAAVLAGQWRVVQGGASVVGYRYPAATFVLTSPVPVDRVPAEGEPVTRTVTGHLTLHGVTREIRLEVRAVLQGGRLAVVGSTEILFADFNIARPRAALVRSVADRGTVEVRLVFERAG